MACAGLLMLSAAGGQAATFTVTKAADTLDGSCDADCSLREAVQAANADATADEIVLPGLRLRLTLFGPSEDANATGDLDVQRDVTIRGPARTSRRSPRSREIVFSTSRTPARTCASSTSPSRAGGPRLTSRAVASTTRRAASSHSSGSPYGRTW
jgi:CSLREA domain-containing protein